METNCVQQVKPLASRSAVCGVLFYECGELGAGKMLEQLIEEACDLYDWIASCGQRLARLPARNCSPTSIIGGHSFYFRTARTCFGQECGNIGSMRAILLIGLRKPAPAPGGFASPTWSRRKQNSLVDQRGARSARLISTVLNQFKFRTSPSSRRPIAGRL